MTLKEYLKENAVPYDLFSDLTEEEKSQSIIDVAIELRKMHYAPVKHGRWVQDANSKFEHRYNCSACDYRLIGEPTNYCPNCGAKMDLEEK